jgi:hypothetical protein
MPIVTIRGTLGSWALEIGRQVADLRIIAEVAARLRRQEEEVSAKEMPPSSLLGRIAEALDLSMSSGVGFEGTYLPTWEIPLDDRRYLQALESVVKELARSPSMVIQGRGSQFILKNYPQTLHVLTVAPVELRVKRVMESQNLEAPAARQEISRFDKGSREFIKRYFQASWEDPVQYDLVINTENLSVKDAASIVIDALSFKK